MQPQAVIVVKQACANVSGLVVGAQCARPLMSSRAQLSLKNPQHSLLSFLSGSQSGRSPFIAIQVWHRKSRWDQRA